VSTLALATHKKLIVITVVGLATLLGVSAAAFNAFATTSHMQVATINLPQTETFKYDGVIVSFNKITLYTNGAELYNNGTPVLTASSRQPFSFNVAPGTHTVITISDSSPIKIEIDGMVFTIHHVVISVAFNGGTPSVSWQAS
jgi:hypothetical protein